MSKSIQTMTGRDWWVFLTSPRGRVNRFDYNVKFFLPVIIVCLIAVAIDYVCLGKEAMMVPGATLYATSTVNLLLIWPFIAMSSKRLQDFNYRGWWLVVIYFLPLFGGSTATGYFAVHGQMFATQLMAFLTFAMLMTTTLILSCAKGTSGPNRFGPNPNSNDVIESAAL